MKNRVLITGTKFHVDTENKVVVCELKCDLQMSRHPAWIALGKEMWKKKFPNVNWGMFTVKAKARCNDIDTFNERKGKMIAESRAKAKMFNIASRVWKECYNKFAHYAIECSGSAEAYLAAKRIEENHVKELSA